MELLFLYLFRFLIRKISIQPCPCKFDLGWTEIIRQVIWFTIKIEITISLEGKKTRRGIYDGKIRDLMEATSIFESSVHFVTTKKRKGRRFERKRRTKNMILIVSIIIISVIFISVNSLEKNGRDVRRDLIWSSIFFFSRKRWDIGFFNYKHTGRRNCIFKKYRDFSQLDKR